MHVDTFSQLYKALIPPRLEYGQLIWSPRFIRQRKKKIENVQRRLNKIVPRFKDLPYDSIEKTKAIQFEIKKAKE